MHLIVFSIVFFISAPTFSQHDHASMALPQKDEVKDEIRVPIDVPAEQQIRIGLKSTMVQKKTVTHTIRTVGVVATNQKSEAHIHSRVNGWIETIYADYVGKKVKRGAALYALYSPELISTQEEYLAANRQNGVGQEIAKTALDRLRLWGVPQTELDKLEKNQKASRTMTFESPISGFIINKSAIQGMYITPGMELYQMADLSLVWIMVTLYEFDIAIIKVGDEANVQIPYNPKLNFKAKISYISPEIEVETRTAKARIEVENRNQNFKPGMYVNVILSKDLGEAIIIPEDAVIDTGLRKIVFVKSGPSRFEPREVKIGSRVENQFAIISGLKAGEEIVTSAHFFIDAESKLRAATLKDPSSPSGPAGQHGGH